MSVFISYRRDDTAGEARALYQDLVGRMAEDQVFMDVDGIDLGVDFRSVLHERLESCDMMLALIGDDWLSVDAETGRRRLDDPDDFVRMELAAALVRSIPVTPVLLQGARMPSKDELPDDLEELSFRNGFELSHERWESDVRELITRLGLATSPPEPGTQRRSRLVDAAAVVGGVVIVGLAAAGAWKFFGPDPGPDEVDPPAETVAAGQSIRWQDAEIVAAEDMTPPLDWAAHELGDDLQGAYQAGFEGAGTTERTLYLCRADHENRLHPGKVVEGRCNIPVGADEVMVGGFEVLTGPTSSLTWEASADGMLPPATRLFSVAASGGDPVPVCRGALLSGSHPGVPSEQGCVISYGGRTQAVTPFELLRVSAIASN